VDAYVAQVDRVLGAGQALYQGPTSRTNISSTEPTTPAAPVKSGLGQGVSATIDHYRHQWRGITALDADSDGTAVSGSNEQQRGSSASTAVRDTARAQAAAIAPAARSPGGVKLLVSNMDERLAAMQRQIDTTKAQNRLLATRLRQLTIAYRMTATAGGSSRGVPMRGTAGSTLSQLGSYAAPPMTALSRVGSAAARPTAEAQLTGLFAREERTGGAATRAVLYAKTKLGLPYVWGAEGPRAYDCSGLVQDAYRHAGIALPRTTYDLITVGRPVPRSEIREGDLILSNFSAPGRPEHVQLAVSPTMVIEAPTPGGHVQYSTIPSGRIVVKRIA